MRLLFCDRNSMKASSKAINQLKHVVSNDMLTFFAPSFTCSNDAPPLPNRINRFYVVNVTLIRWNWHFNLLYSLCLFTSFHLRVKCSISKSLFSVAVCVWDFSGRQMTEVKANKNVTNRKYYGKIASQRINPENKIAIADNHSHNINESTMDFVSEL